MPVQITVRDAPVPESVRARCRDETAALERRFPRSTGCRVVVAEPHRQHRTHNEHEVTVTLLVPGGEVVGRHADPDLGVAVRAAFDAVARGLDEHVERFGEHSAAPPVRHGRVVRVRPDEGYGFLETPDGTEWFVHREDVRGDFDALQPGVEVHFVPDARPRDPDKGPIARSVRPVGAHGSFAPFGP